MSETCEVRDVEAVRLRTNGIELHALAAGPPSGPLVILLHGFPEFSYGWRRQIGCLGAAGLRVLAPDQRGYNLSAKPAGVASYTIDVLADDVLGLADAVGRARFAVVGHDWGGILTWHLAGRNPERVERAVVLNAPHPATWQSYALTHVGQMLRSWYVALFQVPVLPERMLSFNDFAWLRAGMTRSSRPGTFSAEDFRRYREAWARPGALTAMLSWYRAPRWSARSLRPERIRVPLRVIWGDRDHFLESGLVDAGLTLCDYGEAFHIPEATHWVQHEEPEQVNRLLIKFLQ
jgi:epoxide hydrolase 4